MKVVIIAALIMQFGYCVHYFQEGEKIKLYPLQTAVSKVYAESSPVRFFQKDSGRVVGIKDTVIVRFKKQVSVQQAEEIVKEHNATIQKQLGKTFFVLQCGDTDHAVDTANILYKNPQIQYAQPNFIKRLHQR